MEPLALLRDEEAVSSVVSTVLMVAITIVLVAVISSFVLDLGAASTSSPPSTALSITQERVGGATTSVVLTHESGEALEESQVSVTVNGEQAKDWSGTPVWEGSGTVRSGDTANVTTYGSGNTLATGDELRVVWESEDGQQSVTLTDYTVD